MPSPPITATLTTSAFSKYASSRGFVRGSLPYLFFFSLLGGDFGGPLPLPGLPWGWFFATFSGSCLCSSGFESSGFDSPSLSGAAEGVAEGVAVAVDEADEDADDDALGDAWGVCS